MITDEIYHRLLYAENGKTVGVVAHGDVPEERIRDLLEVCIGTRAEHNDPTTAYVRWVPAPGSEFARWLYDAEKGKPGAFPATILDIR